MVSKKKVAVLLCLLLVSSMVATTAAVSAKKPGTDPPEPEPTPEGTVYYAEMGDDAFYLSSMNPDGTSQTSLYVFPGGSMSWDEHGGEYWYTVLSNVGGTYPDEQPCKEIFVCKGNGGTPIQVTDDLTTAHTYLCCSPTWGPEDEFISWSAYRWGSDANGDYVYDAGIYTAPVVYDDDGEITGIGTIEMVYDTGYWSVALGGVGKYHPVARDSLDWSPDGEKVVYGTNDGIHLYDTVGESTSWLADGYLPRWSPDGSLIAYVYTDLFVIKPDGTGGTKIVDVTDTNRLWKRVEWAYWSPDGEFLVYYWAARTTNKTYTYINVVEKDGSSDECISKRMTADNPKPLQGWR